MSTGAELRDAGVARVLEHTEERWKAEANRVIDEWAAAGYAFTAEHLRTHVGDPPGHQNAMGAIFRAAVARKRIRPIAFTTAKRPTSHAGVLRVYRGVEHPADAEVVL